MNAFTSKVMGEINSQSGTFPIAVTISLNRKLALPVFCHIASLPPKRINPGRCLLFFFRRSRSLTYEVKGALALNSLIEWVYRVIPRWQSLRSMSVGVWGGWGGRDGSWCLWSRDIPLSFWLCCHKQVRLMINSHLRAAMPLLRLDSRKTWEMNYNNSVWSQPDSAEFQGYLGRLFVELHSALPSKQMKRHEKNPNQEFFTLLHQVGEE